MDAEFRADHMANKNELLQYEPKNLTRDLVFPKYTSDLKVAKINLELRWNSKLTSEEAEQMKSEKQEELGKRWQMHPLFNRFLQYYTEEKNDYVDDLMNLIEAQ